MPTTTITSKGQITLPKEVREHLGLGEGDRIEFVIQPGGDVQMRPVTGSVRALYGMLRREGAPAPSLDALERTLVESLGEDDARIRKGEA
jgi:AbrB family looped-hinge helix DNA binding protein